jgi:GT2 family glycosyltransferase
VVIAEQLVTAVDPRSLLEAIGQPRDLTLVRGPGQDPEGAPLASARELLADHIYREIPFESVCEARGDTVLLDGSPGFVRRAERLMPRALAVAELRFERVIVLPTAVDLSCDPVREVLSRTRATVFADDLTADIALTEGAASVGTGTLPSARVSAVILSREHPARALHAADSVRAAAVQTAVLVVDNNSPDRDAAVLADGVSRREGVALHRSDRNLGTGGGRSFGVGHTRGEFVLFLDDDAELTPGALDRLVTDLDAHPDAYAVSATVVGADGRVQHSGGWLEVAGGVAEFTPIGAGTSVDELPPSGPAGWVPGTATLARRELFERFPIDHGMGAYYEDNEWCYRIALECPGCFRRCKEAVVMHDRCVPPPPPQDFEMRSTAVELLAAHAAFYRCHGLLLGPSLFDLVHQLRDADGDSDLAAARLLLELVLAKGTDWVFMEWMNGGLRELLHGRGDRHRLQRENDRVRAEIGALQARVGDQQAWIDEHSGLLGYLHDRHETLQRVEQGGWWQLRQRALPALRVVWRLQGRDGA